MITSTLRPSFVPTPISIEHPSLRYSLKYFTSKVVLQLNLAVEMVGSGPHLSDRHTILSVGPLGFEIAHDDASFVVTVTIHFKSLNQCISINQKRLSVMLYLQRHWEP